MLDFAYIALSSTLVPVLRVRGFYGYTDLKNQAFLVLSALHLALCLVLPSAFSLQLSASSWALLGYLLLLTLSACWSDNVEDSVRDLPRWWCLFYFMLVCSRVPLDLVLAALFVPAPFVAAYGLSQQWFRFDPCWGLMRQNKAEVFKKANRFYSFLGNSNYAAAYLAVTFFAGLHLAASGSHWWQAGLVPVWLGLGFTRCRAAWVSVITGLIAANVLLSGSPILLVTGLAAALLVGVIAMQRVESTLGRWFYLRVCIRLLKKRLFFGHGPRVFRRKYFDVQAQMNQEEPTILGTPKNPGRNQFPIGKRAHSDHFETLAESGLVGYGLFLAFLGLCLWQAPDPMLGAGILAGAVHALFFYNLRTAATALPFFGLAGACSSGPFHVSPLVLSAFGVVCLGLFVLRMVWTPYHAGCHFYDAQTAADKAAAQASVHKALILDPNNNMYQSFAAMICMPEDPATGLMHVTACLHANDGQKVAWSLWDQFGRIAYAAGALFTSAAAFAVAHRLNPSYEPACQGLAITGKEIAELRASINAERGTRNAEERFSVSSVPSSELRAQRSEEEAA